MSLLRAKHYPGSYYLLGYAVECAFKACIAKQTVKHDFPKRNSGDLYSHNLPTLLKFSGLKPALDIELKSNSVLEVNWTIVRSWSELARYEISRTQQEAADFHSACVSRKNGVLTWIRKQW